MIYIGPGFLTVVWFGFSPLPCPSPPSLSQSSCVSLEPTDKREGWGGGGGRGAKSCYLENVLTSLNNSTLSNLPHVKLKIITKKKDFAFQLILTSTSFCICVYDFQNLWLASFRDLLLILSFTCACYEVINNSVKCPMKTYQNYIFFD